MKMDLNLLRVFQEIYTQRNLTNAASSLGLTQSAVSLALGRLRRHFDDELFFRVSRGMAPTEKSHLIAPHVSAALHSAENALLAGKGFDPLLSDHVIKIGLVDLDIVFLGPKLVNHFQECAPNITLEFVQTISKNYLDLLSNGEIGIAIHLVERDLPKQFSKMTAFYDKLVVISGNNNAEIGEKLTIDKFAKLPHIKTPIGNVEKQYIEPIFSNEKTNRTIILTVNQMLSVPFLVKEMNVIATVYQSLMECCKDIKKLNVYDFPVEVPAMPISLVWHKKLSGSREYEWVLEEILNMCRKEIRFV